MNTIKTNDEEFKRLENSSLEGPVVMLNLLKFKPNGAADYKRYMKGTGPYLKEVDGKVLFFGKANELLYGEESWDYIMLVEYPSRKAYLKMITNPGYLKVHEYRIQAVERAVLYAADPATSVDTSEK